MHLFGADLDFDGEAAGRLQRRVHLYSLFLTPHILVCVVRPRVLVGPSRKDVTGREDVRVELIAANRSERASCAGTCGAATRAARNTLTCTRRWGPMHGCTFTSIAHIRPRDDTGISGLNKTHRLASVGLSVRVLETPS
jgi:hypothetical protein